MRIKIARIIFFLLLAFLTVLMVRITVPYFSLRENTDFLQTKQWISHNKFWESAFFTHVFTSCLLLVAGFTQFLPPYKYEKLHRSTGKMYILVLLFCSAPAGFVMGLFANGGITSQVSFVTLSLLWIYTTSRAYLEIRKRNFIAHGDFMLRSYALTLSALTLRSWKYFIVLAFHPHPMDVYRIVAWLGWVPNILIAEWMISRGFSKRLVRPAT